jgi:hypothetical protein
MATMILGELGQTGEYDFFTSFDNKTTENLCSLLFCGVKATYRALYCVSPKIPLHWPLDKSLSANWNSQLLHSIMPLLVWRGLAITIFSNVWPIDLRTVIVH